MIFTTLLVAVSFSVSSVLGADVYTLTDNFVGQKFLTDFNHQAIADPTHGRGNYVDQQTALAKNLTFVNDQTIIMRADSTTVISPQDQKGRDTVRIVSKKSYTTHVVVFDVKHMPQGCGTWPAAWEVTLEDWPAGGEVDILEGANDVSPNSITLHTSPGCKMPAQRTMTGTPKQLDCDATLPGNLGCGVAAPDKKSYGKEFNQAGGGFYVMERTPAVINGWFFSRNSNISTVITSGATTLDTASLGTPTATFPNTECDFNQHFKPHNIVINLALCGDWAGSTFTSDGCPGSCVDLVNSNPGAFVDAFWDIPAVRVYEKAPAPARRELHGGRMRKVRRTPSFWGV